jgi:hypothetical protein
MKDTLNMLRVAQVRLICANDVEPSMFLETALENVELVISSVEGFLKHKAQKSLLENQLRNQTGRGAHE